MSTLVASVAPAHRLDAGAPESGTKIDEVMPDDSVRSDCDHRVQGVLGLGVDMIQPGGEHTQTAQLTPMFVRHDVIGIVGPRPVVPKGANGNGLEAFGLGPSFVLGVLSP